MSRFPVAVLLFASLAAAQIDDDNCEAELRKVLAKYEGRQCQAVMQATVSATTKAQCPNKNRMVDCFSVYEDAWTDLLDDCEDLWDDNACLKGTGDDEFERMVKDECAADRRELMAMYDSSDPCLATISSAVYASNDTECPGQKELAECFYAFEDEWTDAVDECEDMFEHSGCTFLRTMGDDEFEEFVKENAASAAGVSVALLAAAGAAVLLAM